MPRFLLFSLDKNDRDLVINDPDEVRHLVRVLRSREGDRIELVNGRGLLAQAEITAVTKATVSVRIISAECLTESVPRVILACALPKKTAFEDVIDKCTQLGVDEIIPMVTERTEIVLDTKRAARKEERFEKIALSAVKQCKRLWAPEIHPIMGFKDVVAKFSSSPGAAFIPWLEERALSVKDLARHCSDMKRVMFYIGPEGDFTPAEVALAQEYGIRPLSLGQNVLRVDTAAITVVAAAKLLI